MRWLPFAITGLLSRLKIDYEKYRFTFEIRRKQYLNSNLIFFAYINLERVLVTENIDTKGLKRWNVQIVEAIEKDFAVVDKLTVIGSKNYIPVAFTASQTSTVLLDVVPQFAVVESARKPIPDHENLVCGKQSY
ncbi:hypothetical protein WN51_00403 [Melipona quadrifasciata]|uniref:Uncharacterized protein n=1 Tax=Melipona quadrifasciata TaxID=166423 RepID=A0A0M8ZZR0_9HYME|nr:hypothetical protein WN51_00403 [Melipona quadrifasciata]